MERTILESGIGRHLTAGMVEIPGMAYLNSIMITYSVHYSGAWMIWEVSWDRQCRNYQRN